MQIDEQTLFVFGQTSSEEQREIDAIVDCLEEQREEDAKKNPNPLDDGFHEFVAKMDSKDKITLSGDQVVKYCKLSDPHIHSGLCLRFLKDSDAPARARLADELAAVAEPTTKKFKVVRSRICEQVIKDDASKAAALTPFVLEPNAPWASGFEPDVMASFYAGAASFQQKLFDKGILKPDPVFDELLASALKMKKKK
jgi:hypothetical protein